MRLRRNRQGLWAQKGSGSDPPKLCPSRHPDSTLEDKVAEEATDKKEQGLPASIGLHRDGTQP